jgi:DNA polymerase elongation subunit (family B)
MNRIYIDIETIPAGDQPIIDILEAPETHNKVKLSEQDKINWCSAKADEEYRKRSLNSMQGQIFCIGVAYNDSEPIIFSSLNPFNILDRFIEQINELDYPELIGHNISFDLAFIYHSCLKQGLEFPAIYLQPKCNLIKDTMKLWNPFDWKSYYKLTDIATFLGIEFDDKATGKEVYDLYLQGKYQEIYNHCISDVELTRQVDKILRNL